MAERLSGTIERVTFHNLESGFAVLRVQLPGRRQLATIVGHLPSATAGEFVEAEGDWITDRDHGQQFRAQQLRTTPPHTVEGIARYLGSGMVKGIGPHFARKIVAVFGERTLDVIDRSPDFLREIKGIGSTRIQRIRASWHEQQAVRKIMLFLQSHGIGALRAFRIHKQYGDRAIETVRANPYALATDIWGIGFKTADSLAERLGIDRQSPLRARAALRYVLQELSGEGHVGFPEAEVIRKTVELTGIPEPIAAAAVEDGRREDEIVRDPGAPPAHLVSSREGGGNLEQWLYLKPLHNAETGVARGLLRLREGDHPLHVAEIDEAVGSVEARMGLRLAPTQRDAIRQAARSKVLVVTGGPGVGKTTIVRGILEMFSAQGLKCGLCAPTGRAAKRLTETTGQEARTIHRLLEADGGQGGFRRGRDLPLELDLIVVDEASMVDMVLMNQLLRAIPPRACLVLVGDVDQLPSVGPGTVLGDVIRSRSVPVVRLTEIFRQAGQSRIVRAAHRVNSGELPESAPAGAGDFYFIEADSPDMILDRIVTVVRERIPARFGLDPLADVQVLTPMNRSELGTQSLNQRLQEVLNPPGEGQQIERYGAVFRTGDKVLQTVNDYDKEVFNGDIGRIVRLDSVDQELTVEFDGRKVVYDFGELDELTLAYALSIHRSQGSEYPAVVVPLHTQHFVMLQRNLLYTAITRGKKLVVLIGMKKALALAVRRVHTQLRHSRLALRLSAADSTTSEPETPATGGDRHR
jgi:exodeoxyribonuclease V alpha subunit